MNLVLTYWKIFQYQGDLQSADGSFSAYNFIALLVISPSYIAHLLLGL